MVKTKKQVVIDALAQQTEALTILEITLLTGYTTNAVYQILAKLLGNNGVVKLKQFNIGSYYRYYMTPEQIKKYVSQELREPIEILANKITPDHLSILEKIIILTKILEGSTLFADNTTIKYILTDYKKALADLEIDLVVPRRSTRYKSPYFPPVSNNSEQNENIS